MIGYPYLRLGELGNLKLTGNLTLTDDQWAGLGAGAGRIVFDDQATDEINLMNCIVGINTETPDGQLEISKDAANATFLISCYHDTEATTPLLTLRKADGTEAAPALVDDNAVLGTILFQGYDGNSWANGAKIEARTLGAPANGDMPAEITFWTTPDGGSETPLQRVTIMPTGNVGVGVTDPGASTMLNVAGRGLFTAGANDPADSTAAGVGISFDGTYGHISALQTGVVAYALKVQGAGGDTLLNPGAGNTGIACLSPAGTLSIGNITEGATASLNVQTAHETHTLAAAGTSTTTTIDVPSGAMVLGASFTVNTAVVDSAGNDSWTAQLDGGAATALGGGAPAQNTKVNTLIVPVIINAETNVKFTPNGGNFSAGVIEIVVYYIDLTSLANV